MTASPFINSLIIDYEIIDTNYSGLMFTDENQSFYSDSFGEVMKYLDFGTMIAGQTSTESKVVLSNTYPFDVKNIKISSLTDNADVSLELSKTDSPFIPSSTLIFDRTLFFDEIMDFYVRISTTENAIGSALFEIHVTADTV